MTTNLAQRYGLTPGTNRTLAVKYSTITGVSQNLPHFLAWARSLGLTDAQILTVDEFSAAHNNEVWRTHGYYPGTGFIAGQICSSRAGIEWPDGRWLVRMPLLAANGSYSGQGNTFWYDPATPGAYTHGTHIEIDHAEWVGMPGQPRACMITSNYGQPITGYHMEGLYIGNVAFDGGLLMGAINPGFESYGLVVWNGGSCAQVERVRADGFNNAGFLQIGAVPMEYRHCRAFRNNEAGLILEGCATSYLHADIECDDNPVAVLFKAGRNGSVAGLGGGVINIKAECGNNRLPNGTSRPQVLMRIQGQVSFSCGSLRNVCHHGVRPDCAIHWDTNSVNSRVQVNSYTDVGTTVGGGVHHLVRSRTATFPHPGNSDGAGFVIRSGNVFSDQR